jgi:adenylylsulfate kinase
MLFRHPRFDDGERDIFYDAMAGLGAALVGRGVPVIFAATANLRAYRDRARDRIARFAEVYVDCPLAVCEARDPKAIYRRAREGGAPHVPGVGAEYEPPLAPDVVVRGDKDAPSAAARRIVGALAAKGWL